MMSTTKIFKLARKQVENEGLADVEDAHILILLRAWEVLKYCDRVERNTNARRAGLK
jgi:hypothetical protein